MKKKKKNIFYITSKQQSKILYGTCSDEVLISVARTTFICEELRHNKNNVPPQDACSFFLPLEGHKLHCVALNGLVLYYYYN